MFFNNADESRKSGTSNDNLPKTSECCVPGVPILLRLLVLELCSNVTEFYFKRGIVGQLEMGDDRLSVGDCR